MSSDETQHNVDDIKQVTAVVQDLITMMKQGNVESLQLSFGSFQVSLHSANGAVSARPAVTYAPDTAQPAQVTEHEQENDSSGHLVAAPMIGTFYIAPAPNEPAFVGIGDQVVEGQTIGIIEAMKIMNEIAADRSGTVVEIIATDGQTVEYGSPLLRIDPTGV
jgi:acetyl-CoA carboxylase biotin carboxyl carrier protein